MILNISIAHPDRRARVSADIVRDVENRSLRYVWGETLPQQLQLGHRRVGNHACEPLQPFDVRDRDRCRRFARAVEHAGRCVLSLRQNRRGLKKARSRHRQHADRKAPDRNRPELGITNRREPDSTRPRSKCIQPRSIRERQCRSHAEPRADDHERPVFASLRQHIERYRRPIAPVRCDTDVAVEVPPLNRDALPPKINEEAFDAPGVRLHHLRHVLQNKYSLLHTTWSEDQLRPQARTKRVLETPRHIQLAAAPHAGERPGKQRRRILDISPRKSGNQILQHQVRVVGARKGCERLLPRIERPLTGSRSDPCSPEREQRHSEG